MKRTTLHAESAYILGLVILAFGTVLMEKAAFGMSMIVAPAYNLYLKVSQTYPWFTFGMAEYSFQALLLVLLSLVLRKFKPMFLFSFFTALLYGVILDGFMKLSERMPLGGIPGRIGYYLSGMAVCALGVALLFNTYIAPEAYELTVKELSSHFQVSITKTKTVYDCVSCILAVIMSFVFFGFGHFEGVKWGTIFCALVNGWCIGRTSDFLNKHFEVKDAFRFRPLFS